MPEEACDNVLLKGKRWGTIHAFTGALRVTFCGGFALLRPDFIFCVFVFVPQSCRGIFGLNAYVCRTIFSSNGVCMSHLSGEGGGNPRSVQHWPYYRVQQFDGHRRPTICSYPLSLRPRSVIFDRL